jgi:hypothetical protein
MIISLSDTKQHGFTASIVLSERRAGELNCVLFVVILMAISI